MKLRRKPKDSAEEQKPEKQKPKGVLVGKFDISDNVVKFYAAKGFGKKQWVSIREIPVLEIEQIDKFGNELTITWKGSTDAFYTKEKTDSFGKLVDQINGILEEHRRTVEKEQKAALRQNELLTVINKSLTVLDSSFDILIGLQDKRINWQQLEAYTNSFSDELNFAGQTLPPLSLNFGRIAPAVKTQVPKEASAEAFDLLKATYGYFDGLNLESDVKDALPTFGTTKRLIYAYFLLNDLLLAKAVGEKDSGKETGEFEATLRNLSEANFKVDVEKLKGNLDQMNSDGDRRTIITDCRTAFKEQLKHVTEKQEPPQETAAPTEPAPQPSTPIEPTSQQATPTEITPQQAAPEKPTAPEPAVEAAEPVPASDQAAGQTGQIAEGPVAPAVASEPQAASSNSKKKRSWFKLNRKSSDIRKDN